MQGHTYHWKHGWIPLDHVAALSKAHHSKSGAAKEMQKRGIPVPKGYHSDHKGTPPTPAAKPSPAHGTAAGHALRAAQLREAAAKKRAEADRIAGSVGAPDRAGAMLRAKDSARMNARMDSGLRRFTEAQQQAKALESKAHLAEGRAKEAARTHLGHEDIKGATHVRDQYGWHEVVRVNAKTVTVKTPYSWTDSIPHEKVHQVLRATPAQIAAAHAKAAAKKK